MRALLLILGTALAAPLAPAAEGTWQDAVRQGEFKLAMRFRVEQVGDDALPLDATASTVRTRLTWRSAAWRGWSLVGEADDVRALGGESYNSTRNGQLARPLVADPHGTSLNQALVQYSGSRYSLALGRQRLVFDDQRFIGGVAWRQNEQTFDAASVRARWQRLDLNYSLVANVSRVFGPHRGTPPADLRGPLHLLNARLDAGVLGSVVGFGYLLDFKGDALPGSRTLGLRSTGSHPLVGRTRWLHTASIATQEETGNSPALQAGYTLIELGLRRDQWSLLAGRERLEGHATLNGRSFQAPLGTLHLFQGWADKFSSTPAQGIDDRYLSLAGTWQSVKVQLAWHDFRAEAVDRSFGEEWDASFAWQLSRRYELLLKAADYRSHGFAADTRKLWMQFNAAF